MPLAAIRLLVLDVDGVLTDGRLYFGPRGEALKVFHVRDGHGIVQLRRAGVAGRGDLRAALADGERALPRTGHRATCTRASPTSSPCSSGCVRGCSSPPRGLRLRRR